MAHRGQEGALRFGGLPHFFVRHFQLEVDTFHLDGSLFELCLDGSPIGDVAEDPGEGTTAAQVDLADGQVEGKRRPIFPPADDFTPDPDDLRMSASLVVL